MPTLATYRLTVSLVEAPSEFAKVTGVYALTHCNLPPYFGQSENVGERIATHVSELKSGKHHCWRLQAAYSKAAALGSGNPMDLFTASIEYECSIAELDTFERRAIRRWDKKHPDEKCLNTNLHQKQWGGKTQQKALPAPETRVLSVTVVDGERISFDTETGNIVGPADDADTNGIELTPRQSWDAAYSALKAFARQCEPGTTGNLILSQSTHGPVTYLAQLIGPRDEGEIDLVSGSSAMDAVTKITSKGVLRA